MADNTLSYAVMVDASSARQAAATVKATFQRELNNIQVGGAGGGGKGGASWMTPPDLGDLPGRLDQIGAAAERVRAEYAAMGSAAGSSGGSVMGALGGIATKAGIAGIAIGALKTAWSLGAEALAYDAGGAATSIDQLNESFEKLKLSVGRGAAPTVDNLARGLAIITARLAGEEETALRLELEALEKTTVSVIPGVEGVNSELGDMNWQADMVAERIIEVKKQLEALDGTQADISINFATHGMGDIVNERDRLLGLKAANEDYAKTKAEQEKNAPKPTDWNMALAGQTYTGGVQDYYASFLAPGAERGRQQIVEKELLDQQTEGIKEWQAEQDRIAQEEEERIKQAQRDWEQATKDMARAFESALRSVPGLFGTSTVTDEDMTMAKAGLYQPKADEYLRRLKAEVEQGQDLFPEVDIREAARRGGLPEDADPKALYTRLEQMWASGELFADKANIPYFMDPSVVGGWLNQAKKGETGQQNLLNFFGLAGGGPQQFAMTGMGGPFPMGQQMPPLDLQAVAPNLAMQGAGKQLIQNLTAELSGEEARQMLDTASKVLVSGMSAGWENNIASTPWAAMLEAGILADLIKYFENKQ